MPSRLAAFVNSNFFAYRHSYNLSSRLRSRGRTIFYLCHRSSISQQVASQKYILLDSDNPYIHHNRQPGDLNQGTRKDHWRSGILRTLLQGYWKRTNARIWIENDQTDNSTLITDNYWTWNALKRQYWDAFGRNAFIGAQAERRNNWKSLLMNWLNPNGTVAVRAPVLVTIGLWNEYALFSHSPCSYCVPALRPRYKGVQTLSPLETFLFFRRRIISVVRLLLPGSFIFGVALLTSGRLPVRSSANQHEAL